MRRRIPKEEKRLCEYCGRPIGEYYRANRRYCSDKCRKESRLDKEGFGGLRRTAIGYDNGTCWICGKEGLKGRRKHVHHVVGRKNAQEPLVVLCTGCHSLVSELGRRVFLEDGEKVEDMLTLARFVRGLPNARTIVKYEEVK